MAVSDLLNSIGNFFGAPQGPTKNGAPVSDPWMDLLNLAGGVYGRNQANKAITQNNVPTAAETQQNAIYQALANPNSPMMKQATDQARAQNLSDFQSQLNEMQLADRRAGQMGRAPTFFAPERADETMSYLTSRGLPALNAAATQQARAGLTATAQGYGTLQNAQAGRLSTTTQQGVSNAQYNGGTPAAILNILRGTPQQQPVQQQTPLYGTNTSNMNPQMMAMLQSMMGGGGFQNTPMGSR